jgi:hypothetical protein
MKRYIAHHFPNELKTYALLTLASVLTVVAISKPTGLLANDIKRKIKPSNSQIPLKITLKYLELHLIFWQHSIP